MWNTKSKGSTDITMSEGDYGIQLPFPIIGVTIAKNDYLKFTFKTERNGDAFLEKIYTDIAGNTVDLSFTAAESALFDVGNYVYSLDWYDGTTGLFNYCLIDNGKLKVEDKI